MVVPSRTLWSIATQIWRLDPARLRYVPNGVDLGRFADAAGTMTIPGMIPGTIPGTTPGTTPGQTPVVGTVAALRAEKNIGRLLRAFALATPNHQGRLVIIGDGPERGALEAAAASLGIGGRVQFAGHIADPAALFKQFDVFAMSSDTEQMPLSLLEAMAAGLPVASTDVGDIRSMLAPANRSYVTALDDAALADSLRALIDRSALRRELGIANRARAEQEFDQAKMFSAWAAVFDGTLGPARPS